MMKPLPIGLACILAISCGETPDPSLRSPEPVSLATSPLNPADAITLTGESQLTPRRQALRNLIWGSTGLTTTQAVFRAPTANCQIPGLTNVSMTEELRIPMDVVQGDHSQEGLACHFVSSSPNGRLVVFNPGHACTVADGSNWSADAGSYGDQRAIQTLLVDGYGVLVTFMPHVRPDDCGSVSHETMFATLHPAQGSVWKYFLQPVSDSLNYLVANAVSHGFPQYSEFDMLGLSGGGWTTTVYAAIDTRITKSVNVAGSEPLEFWNNFASLEEQTLPALYNVAAYRDLYILGAAGQGRRQIQVLNRRDDCCFFPGWLGLVPGNWESSVRTYESAIRSAMINMGDRGFFRVEIDEAAVQHQISRNNLANVALAELEGGRQHVGAASATDAFVRGGNGHLWHFGPAAWEDTGLNMVGVPAVLLNVSHPIDVFYRDQSNGLRQAWKAGSAWTSQSLTGVIVSDPAVVSWGPGRFDIVAFGGDNALYHWSSSQSGFDLPVASLRGVGTPTMVSAGTNSLDAFFRDMTGGVSRLFWDGSNWGSEALGASILGMPSAAVTFDPGSVPVRRVYALGHDNMLYEDAKHGAAAWSTWLSVSLSAGAGSTKLAGSPRAVIRSSDSAVTVHVRTAANQLAIFARPAFWSLSLPGGTVFQGAPTPLPSGGSWVDGAALNDLQLFSSSSGTFSGKGGVIE
jgi:hypothetical protein